MGKGRRDKEMGFGKKGENEEEEEENEKMKKWVF